MTLVADVLADVTHAAMLTLAPHGLQGRARANARAAMLVDAEHARLRAEAAAAWTLPQPMPAEVPAAS